MSGYTDPEPFDTNMSLITVVLRLFQTATNLSLLGILVGAVIFGGALVPAPLEQLEARGALVGVLMAVGYVLWSTRADFRLQLSEIGRVLFLMFGLASALATGCVVLGALAHVAGIVGPNMRTLQALGTLAGFASAVVCGIRDVRRRHRRETAQTLKYARYGVVYPRSF
jgi:hypothetical protein